MAGPDDAGAKFARAAWMRALQRVAAIDRRPEILPILIDRQAAERGSDSALESTEDALTYRELARRMNQYARWGLSQGLAPGDTVCLDMMNCAEYLAVWLGLTRIGVSVALANPQLSGEVLAHAIGVVAPKLVLAGAARAPVLAAARAALPRGLPCFVRGPSREDLPGIDTALAAEAPEPVSPAECAIPPLDANALYIYTSGTTGLPKAARVSHRRVMQWSQWFAGLMDTSPGDRMYDCLPLHHSVGGVVATGALLVAGGSVVIRRRFSASDFWRDVREQRCTLFQYIGELCRYLVNSPPDPSDGIHSLRIACGNGLRPEIWGAFKARFRIPRILEYYAATEGTFSLYNCEGEPGAIGRIPPYLRNSVVLELVKFDVDSGEPCRGADGRCLACGVDEIGEAIGKGRFEGYADAAAGERKLLKDVFAPGDTWYRTGDLMRRDARGFYFFVDRVGDTFRWKGENVSTAQVESVLAAAPGVLEAIVYGVSVPGAEGRAGMAALVVDPSFEVGRFRDAIAASLPAYARPLFLRILGRMQTTSTWKPVKRDLLRSGFDPSLSADPLFFDSPQGGGYAILDRSVFEAISSGTTRI